MDCEAIETALRDFFARENRGEAAAYLFGSVARREAGPERVRFEVRKRNEYFDLQPILHRYWKLGGASS